MTASYLREVIIRFGPPRIDCFSADWFRVWLPDRWHFHSNAMTGPLSGQGETIEEAARRLMEHTTKPGVTIAEGTCNDRCFEDYCRSHSFTVAAREFWAFVKSRRRA